MDTKEAYKILGLRENASKDEVERKFAIVLKKYRAVSSEQPEDEKSGIDIDQVTRAYNLLMGYSEEPEEEQAQKPPNPILKKIGVDEKKAKNFLYYYKYHILIGVILLIVLVTTLKSCITRVDPDFNIAFVGSFYYADTEVLKDIIRSKIPEIKEPGFDAALLNENMDGEQEYAMQMKAMVLFAAADVDIFIMDKVNFERYAKQGAFQSLDELADTLGIDKTENKDFIMKAQDEPEEHLYGIDASESPLFADSEIYGEEKIVCISVRAKHYDKAVLFLKALLE